MKLEFKNVAHLYLPFLAECDDKRCVVNGYSVDEDLFQINLNEQDSDWWNTSNFKPILRKVETISDDEKKELFSIVFGRDFPKSGQIIWRSDKTTSSDPRWILMSGVDRLGIEISGNVWADCDLHNYKFNQHLVTKFLLKKGFDLFELIKNNKAVEV